MENIVLIILGIVVVLVITIISMSNKLNRLQIKIEEADSGIDIALAKRYDVLTKMIEVVKGYAKHEKEIIFEIVKLRKGMSLESKNAENEKMNHNMEKINILAEAYPDLKANENFIYLQKTILEVEEHLQAARRFFNSNVSAYNQMIAVFPSNIVAKSKHLTKKQFFAVDETIKENVKIEL